MKPQKLILLGATLALGALASPGLAGQQPIPAPKSHTGSLSSPTVINPALQNLIERAEQHYQKGVNSLQNGQCSIAREAFDQAIEVLLTADNNLRQETQFRTYYLELVEKVYRNQLAITQALQEEAAAEELATQEDTSEESPSAPALLDEISRIDLDAEGVSKTANVEVDVKSIGINFQPHPAVTQFINYFTQNKKGRVTMETGLRRSGRYRAMVEQIFKEEGVPLDVMWLAQVESVWIPHALSSAAAKGIWQFIPSTGTRYELAQNEWVDERCSPEKATRAAARYLKFLNGFFGGDWLLAMGAYNCGENGMDRAVARSGYADFWDVYDRHLIPAETRNYVPAILAVMLIAKNPEKYGFQVTPDPQWQYDTFEVKSAMDLTVAASLINVPVNTLRELNPELKRNAVPAGFTLRLPASTQETFETAFEQLTPDQYAPRVVARRYNVHYVRGGRGRYRVKQISVRGTSSKGRHFVVKRGGRRR
jgi:membrane-bound lytic murein transglycosylase D